MKTIPHATGRHPGRASGARRLASPIPIVLILLAVAACCATAGQNQRSSSEPPKLAGVLAMDDGLMGRWAWSGAWVYPVGDRYSIGSRGADSSSAYRVSRNVEKELDGSLSHEGADLCNHHPGGTVRAAGNGLVVVAGDDPEGYGIHVVLAHRLENGQLAYSCYAHLVRASLMVSPGQMVHAGQPLGRVGETGHATSEHLHFEIRLTSAAAATEPWKSARVVDPIAFVAARLPVERADTSWARPYLEWAECSALVGATAPGDRPLQRAMWWQMLGRAARHRMQDLPADPDSLRAGLVAARALPTSRKLEADGTVGWDEMERDLARVRRIGSRLPPCPVGDARHRALCAFRLQGPYAERSAKVARRPPTLADACLTLADLSADRDVRASRTPARRAR